MSSLHEMDALRPAPRTTSPLVLWILCAVAVGGIWLLHEGVSQMPTQPIASIAAADTETVAGSPIATNQSPASIAGTDWVDRQRQHKP